MFSLRTVLVLFIFALIAIVGSTNGQQGCDDLSQRRQEMFDEQVRRSEESMDRIGRITISCETSSTSGGSSSGNSNSVTIIEISIGLFFLIWVAIAIWYVFVSRQKAMNAAGAITPYPGEVGAKEMGNGMDEKTKTVDTSVPGGKVPYGNTNV